MGVIYRIAQVIFVKISVLVALSGSVRPIDASVLNYTHVLFEWEQTAGSTLYQLQVAQYDTTLNAIPFDSLLVLNHFDSSLVHIVTSGLAWETSYVWRVRGITALSDTGIWSVPSSFAINSLPAQVPTMHIDVLDPVRYQPGLTGFNLTAVGILVVVDQNGMPVWFAAQNRQQAGRVHYAQQLPNGNVLTLASGSAYIITLENELLWQPPDSQETGLHHGLIRLPNGNIMGISRETRLMPVPDGPWSPDYESKGIDSVAWRADVLLEWNRTGMEVWRWNSWDYFDPVDFDSTAFSRVFPLNQKVFDWTHTNALFYDPIDNTVFISARHLDRITKIDHDTGNIIWNMGRPMPSGTVQVGNDLEFSYQHAIEVTGEGTLVLYDNGNLKDPPYSRGIEITLTETDSVPMADITWEYALPDSLYTANRGDCDKLANGIMLITAANPAASKVNAHILEIDPTDNSLVWQLRMSDKGTSATSAAERIPGLYPQAFSVLMPDFDLQNSEPTVSVEIGEFSLHYTLSNKGWMDETYDYSLIDDGGWISGSGAVTVQAGRSAILEFTGFAYDQLSANKIQLAVIPQNAPLMRKEVKLYAYVNLLASNKSPTSLPREFAFYPNYPNPFNPTTTIQFDLPLATDINIVVYDLLGREVVRLLSQQLEPGFHELVWNGRDRTGLELPTGIYIIQMRTPEYSKSIKLVLLK